MQIITCKLDETQLRNSFKETNRKEYAEIVNSSNDTQNKPTEKIENPIQVINASILNHRCAMLAFINPVRRNLCFSNAAASCLLNIQSLQTFVLEVTKNK